MTIGKEFIKLYAAHIQTVGTDDIGLLTDDTGTTTADITTNDAVYPIRDFHTPRDKLSALLPVPR